MGVYLEEDKDRGGGRESHKFRCLYRDPKTGLPYATKEAFKEIRQRFAEENANNRKEMAMGTLYDSVSGCGFSLKKKRSMMPDKSVHTNFRPYARIRKIPASEDEESD
ncbi:hypothetical protein PIB30_055082 [Stylosanthes scabra]|uniref:Vps72/YL1 C-terminal domain-containing protein n=1 Tax=Stylosanthes scabra TaxID=79078 RepID=A0ABU6RJ90_9FABA|nr:hypothetical protein [Stylosanthes scabra]